TAARRAALAEALLEHLLRAEVAPGRLRLDWHLGEEDVLPVAPGQPNARLLRLARCALAAPELTFVCDRPRRPLALAEGLDRRHPAVLLTVGLQLPRLAELPGLQGDPERFLQKLSSLARLALSAAVQKRDFLRRHRREHPTVSRTFLLDRARLVVVPIGLETVVQRLLGRGLT